MVHLNNMSDFGRSELYRSGQIEKALIHAFLKMDQLMATEHGRMELREFEEDGLERRRHQEREDEFED